jgi:DNA-binding response OmpR family regulator
MAEPADGSPSEPEALRITIVDDDRETREMLRVALEREGYEVNLVSNGLRLISSLHVDRPDLVLLDVVMSWIDGFELCLAIKKNPDFKDIPIIFVSARGADEDVARGYECGCADYVTKPVDVRDLQQRIKRVLQALDRDG